MYGKSLILKVTQDLLCNDIATISAEFVCNLGMQTLDVWSRLGPQSCHARSHGNVKGGAPKKLPHLSKLAATIANQMETQKPVRLIDVTELPFPVVTGH